VAGIDPQTLMLVRGEGHESVSTFGLKSDFRREVLLRFGPEGRFLYVEGEDGLTILEPARERESRISLPGRLQSFAAGTDFAAATTAGAGAARLLVFRPPASPLAEARLASAPKWSRISGKSLLVGLENELVRADVVEQ
jgi:hypothetical protein